MLINLTKYLGHTYCIIYDTGIKENNSDEI